MAAPSATAVRADLAGVCASVAEAGPHDAVDGVAAALVVSPTTTAQVADVMRVTAAHGLRVVVRGRGTKLTWGRPPTAVDVVLDMCGMAAVLDHVAGDLVVAVEAGVRVEDLQLAVGGARQRLAVDGGVAGASIGGTVATATSGPRRLATGTVRDLLIGVTLVRTDGAVARAGGRVVKNVAGYDLCKLLTGSFGTLAVITEAIFRLHPLPTDARYVTVTASTIGRLGALSHRIVASRVAPAGVEVDLPPGGPASLTVLLEGSAAGVASRSATVSELLGEGAVTTLLPPSWWAAYPWSTSSTGDSRATALKLTHAIGALSEVLAAVADAPAEVHVRGSAGTGVLYGAIDPGTDVATVAATVAALREVTGRHGGAAVVLDSPDAVTSAVDTWGPVAGLDLMRRVKQQFDPDGRLAPGRFVGGM